MALSLQFKGLNYVANYNGDYENGDTYQTLLDTGANTISIVVQNGINVASSSVFQSYSARPNNDIGATTGFTETQAGTNAQIRSSESSGQSVIVRPLIDFLDPTVTGISTGQYDALEFRKDYMPTNLGAFFQSYTSFIVAQATAAQADGAQIFDIGTELDELITTATMPYWSTLISDVRAVFHGQLTYSSSWTTGGSAGSVASIPNSFWQQLDYVGVDAYVYASDPNNSADIWSQPPTDPTQAAIFGSGNSAIDFFNGIAEAAGKPLIITETGDTNATDAASNPLDQNGTPSATEQAALYQAFFNDWAQAGPTALVGASIWDWNPYSGDYTNPTDFTPQDNSNSLAAITAGFSGPAPYIVTLNGGHQTVGAAIGDTTGSVEVIVTAYATGAGNGSTNDTGASVNLNGANTYSGGTLIEAGTVVAGSSQAFGTGGLDLLTGELVTSGYNLSFSTLRGTGEITDTTQQTSVDVLTVGAGSFSGSIEDIFSQNPMLVLELDKVGAGTLELSGSSQFAELHLDGGTLEVANPTSAGGYGSEITFGSGAATLLIDNAAILNAANYGVSGEGQIVESDIGGFAKGDTIDLKGIGGATLANASFTYNAASGSQSAYDALTLAGVSGVAGGKVTLKFDLTNTSSAGVGDFGFASDGSGGTLVTWVAAAAPAVVAPVVSSAAAARATTSSVTVRPFAQLTIGDGNAGATETLTIALTVGNGTLSGTGLSGSGDSYSLSGTAAAVTAAMDALAFTPTAGLAAPGTPVTTAFIASINDGIAPIVAYHTSTVVNYAMNFANDLTHSGTASGYNNFIDLLNFEASYGDLIKTMGTNQSAMQYWYNTYEPTEQRIETFDGLDYIASYGDLSNAFRSTGSLQAVEDAGASHYISYGVNEGRETSFNGLDYIASYDDLIKAFGTNSDSGAYHYIEYGATEGRKITFDGLDYIASYGDLINAFGANEQAGAAHYISYGSTEGRTTTFDGLDYIASYGDLINALGDNNDAGASHYIKYGFSEGRTTSFDGLAYIANYTDLMTAFGANNDAGASHYISFGSAEGRATTFNVNAYETAHSDLVGKYASNDQFLTAYINTFVTTGHLLT